MWVKLAKTYLCVERRKGSIIEGGWGGADILFVHRWTRAFWELNGPFLIDVGHIEAGTPSHCLIDFNNAHFFLAVVPCIVNIMNKAFYLASS